MDDKIRERTLDFIYEAAIAADRWPAVLETIAHQHGARGGALFARQQAGVQWATSTAIRQDYEDFLTEGWHTRNVRVERGRALNHPGFITDTDIHNEAEMATIPIYRDYFIPRGLGAGAATFVQGVGGDELVFTIEGFTNHDDARASLSSLDTLRPHLARAGMLAARLSLQHAQVAATALEMIGTPAAIMGSGRHLLAINDLFSSELSAFGTNTRNGIVLADASADAHLERALTNGQEISGLSIPLKKHGCACAVLHVIPVRGAGRDILAGAISILLIATVGMRRAPSTALIQGLLGLTPAEARLAGDLATGLDLAMSASRANISILTARAQLKSIFAKTGLNRQAALTAMLADLSPPLKRTLHSEESAPRKTYDAL